MAFNNRDPCNRIGETQAATVGRETEMPCNLEAVVTERPVRVQCLEEIAGLVSPQWLGASFAGLTAAIGEVGGHDFLTIPQTDIAALLGSLLSRASGDTPTKKPAPQGRQSGDSR